MLSSQYIYEPNYYYTILQLHDCTLHKIWLYSLLYYRFGF